MKGKWQNIIKGWIYNLLLLCLLFPLVAKRLNLDGDESLSGYTEEVKEVSLTKETWLSGEYQLFKQERLAKTFGFRSLLVNIYNQGNFSLFRKVIVKNVICGKDNMLFEKDYIETYLGKDFVGESAIDEKLRKLERVVDTLKKMNKEVIVAIAPGKAYYYNEYIPSEYSSWKKGETNYEVYAEKLSNSKLHVIDYQKWFKEMKDTASYPLFPKTGTHWTIHGALLAADSLVNYLRYDLNYSLPRIIRDQLVISDTTRESDDDIEKALNLMYDIKDFSPLAYWNWHHEPIEGGSSPKMITIGDSFWSVLGWAMAKRFFNDGKFCYYGMEFYTLDEPIVEQIGSLNIKEEFEKNDVILILQTDSNLSDLGFGVIEKLYEAYFGD